MLTAREKGSRALLYLARRTSNIHVLELARWVAGDNRAANAALYYVGVRYFGLNARVLRAAVNSALKARPDEGIIIHPFLELKVVPRERRVPAILDAIELSLRHLEDGRDITDERTKFEISAVLAYGRDMLLGNFSRAYERWSAMSGTRHVLSRLDDVATTYPASSLTSSFSEDTTLAVVLPGVATASDIESIKQHHFIGRTCWNPATEVPNGESKTDLVFLNLDRFTELCKNNSIEDAPLIITKGPPRRMRVSLKTSLEGKVLFELLQPRVPAALMTYLPVTIALWSMASLHRPATFFCGDFYLGEKAYKDDKYDQKRHLSSIHDVRLSYLGHDVFFVHAFLAHWLGVGKIAAHGSLESLLTMSGSDFALCMEERWGSR